MLALALVSLLLSPPWHTVAQASAPSNGTARPAAAAFLAGTRAQTSRFAALLRERDSAAARSTDFTKDVVVVAIAQAPTPCYKLKIVGLHRVGGTLTVSVKMLDPAPGTACVDIV